MGIFDALKRKKPQDNYRELRSMALSVKAAQLGLDVEPDTVIAAFLEMQMGAPVTLVAMAEGSVSMYFGNGGGIIGAGQHPEVREAAEVFLSEMQKALPRLAVVEEAPLPVRPRTRFHARTSEGTYSVDCSLEQLMYDKKHPLHQLAMTGNDLITQVRLATTRSQR